MSLCLWGRYELRRENEDQSSLRRKNPYLDSRLDCRLRPRGRLRRLVGRQTAHSSRSTPAWQLTLDAGGESGRRLPPTGLVGGACRATGGTLVVLADGGVVRADDRGRDKDKLAAESKLLGPLKLPLESLAGPVFRGPAGRPSATGSRIGSPGQPAKRTGACWKTATK